MEDNSIHVGGSGLALWQRLLQPKVIIPVVAVVLIGGGGYVAYTTYNSYKQKQKQVTSAVSQAEDALVQGNSSQSLDALKIAASKAQTKAEKVRVYTDLAAASLNVGKYQDALNYMQQKHKIDPSTAKADAIYMGMIYEKLGKKDLALAQYRIALDNAKNAPADANGNARGDSSSYIQQIEAMIKNLEKN